MHNILRFYSIHQERVLRMYMFMAKFIKLPIVGNFMTILMNWYATTQHKSWVLTSDEAKKVVDAATSIAVGDCTCRKVFNNCDGPIKTDIVIGIGYNVFTEVRKDDYVKITREEAKSIIDECRRMGLIQSLVQCKGEVYSLCNCCQCCCVPLRLNKVYGIKKSWQRDKNIVEELPFTLTHGNV
jgi:hypothetical protein